MPNAVPGLFYYVEKPTVGLLNIGTEHAKGSKNLLDAYAELSSQNTSLFTFIGNIEPHDILFSDVDVVVTSGFTGNIVVKTFEAAAEYFSSPSTKEGMLGAYLIGLQGYIFKCHGNASMSSITNTLLLAQEVLKKNLYL